MSSALGIAPAGGSVSKRTSRSRRAASDRVMSRNARHATVMSHPVGSAGASSLPRGERPDERLLHGVLGRREVGSATDEDAQHPGDELAQLDVVHGHSVTVGRLGQEGPDLQPLVDRLAAGPGCGRQLTGELDRPLVAVDVDHHPARDQVLRLGERAVGHRRAPLAVGADPHAVGRQRLAVDELAAALEPGGEVVHELGCGPRPRRASTGPSGRR